MQNCASSRVNAMCFRYVVTQSPCRSNVFSSILVVSTVITDEIITAHVAKRCPRILVASSHMRAILRARDILLPPFLSTLSLQLETLYHSCYSSIAVSPRNVAAFQKAANNSTPPRLVEGPRASHGRGMAQLTRQGQAGLHGTGQSRPRALREGSM